jgi:hypothetical protein
MVLTFISVAMHIHTQLYSESDVTNYYNVYSTYIKHLHMFNANHCQFLIQSGRTPTFCMPGMFEHKCNVNVSALKFINDYTLASDSCGVQLPPASNCTLLLSSESVADSGQLLSAGDTRTLIHLHEMSQQLTSCDFSTTVRVQYVRSNVQRQGQDYVHYVQYIWVKYHNTGVKTIHGMHIPIRSAVVLWLWTVFLNLKHDCIKVNLSLCTS